MKRFFKWIAIMLGALVGIILISAFVFYNITTTKMAKKYDISPEKIVIPTDTASLDRGSHLVKIICSDCHGKDLSGSNVFSDPSLGEVNAVNLTAGKGGAGQDFTDADWVRAIRHGVDDKGRGLVVMPSGGLYYLSDADLGAIIAYVKSLPPVDKEWKDPTFTPTAKVLAELGAFGNLFAVETIPHTAPRPVTPPQGATPEYGGYLVNLLDCRTCHGPALSGGKDPNPEAPPAPNLTSGGDLGKWSESDFTQTIRGGITPSGKVLSKFMPWKTYGNMTDEELSAVFKYLNSLPSGSN